MFDLSERMDTGAVVRGTEAAAYCIFPDGRRKVVANLIKLEAKANYSKVSYPILGLRIKPQRKGAGEITGTMTLHYNSSDFREAALEYQRTGVDSYYDLQLVNEDPDSKLGKQVVILYGVNFDEVPLAMIDAESEYLTEELSFTANGWDLENVFDDGGLKDA